MSKENPKIEFEGLINAVEITENILHMKNYPFITSGLATIDFEQDIQLINAGFCKGNKVKITIEKIDD